MNKLAIIIPYFKASFFEDTILSIANQKDKRFTLYIGNDASDVNPQLIIENILKDINYRYYYYDVNYGKNCLTSQWERILSNIEEEWFQILGDDDLLSNDFVEVFYKELRNFKEDVNLIRFRDIRINEYNTPLESQSPYKKRGLYNIVDHLLNKFYGNTFSSLSENVFRKTAFDKIGFVKYPLAWHSDDMLLLQICNAEKFYFISDSHVLVRLSSQSISGSDTNLEKKSLASYMFFNDFLMISSKLSFFQKIKLFKIIRRFHVFFGLEKANELIKRKSFVGRVYVCIASFKDSFLKKV